MPPTAKNTPGALPIGVTSGPGESGAIETRNAGTASS